MHLPLAQGSPVRPTGDGLWSRPAGLREALLTAVPLMVSSLSLTVMNFIDRLFLLWYSPDAVAASLPAGILSFGIIALPLGVASYVSTFVAQYHGAGRDDRVGPIVWQAVWIGALSIPLAAAAVPAAPTLFAAGKNPPSLIPLEIEYFTALSYSGGAIVLSAALSAFFSGRGEVRTVMIVDTAAAALNVVLDYCWIFGHAGFPEAGIAGAGWATTVALWCKTAAYGALFVAPRFRHRFNTLGECAWRASSMRRLVRFGFPSGLQMMLEVGAFGLFTLLVGRLGPEALAATSLAFNVNNFAFMPIWGVGIAASTMVGRRLGEERPDLAARSTWSALVWALVYMGSVCIFYLALPEWVLALHRRQTSETDPTYGGLHDTTVFLLRFVASFGLLDAVNVVFSGALKGAGDVRFVMFASTGIAAAGVVVTWLGMLAGGGLVWCWAVLTAWVVALAAVFLRRFLQGAWRSMRVIEPQ
mgnify:CR=1 FL=1